MTRPTAAADHHHHYPSEATTHHLPLVLLHNTKNFTVPFQSHLQARFHLIDPNTQPDPSLQPISTSIRVILCVGPSPLPSTTLNLYPSLELVVGAGVGVDHIDLHECRRRNIRVANAGDAFSDDTADYAVGLLIDVLRGVSLADRFVRAGSWASDKEFPLGRTVAGKRIGVVGLGSIGSRICRRLEGFGCRIAYNSRRMKPEFPYQFYGNVHDLAANSDVLILSCALTDETYHVINKDVMRTLGKGGVIINIGRGALIDEKELVECLIEGIIGGAGLDVYENEPNVPEELFELDNVVLSPHKAVVTPESFKALADVVVGNLEAFFSNKPLVSEIWLNVD
ncbi:dehydrogenase [Lithospermum erythrorhizon]|uniref:Dehydrogenase n=1 Tax=Lithospermum erythrorhizon TaxID=34254 RepID=A0AAV3NZ55_LITER